MKRVRLGGKLRRLRQEAAQSDANGRCGQPLPSAPLSRGFVAQLERFVTKRGIPLVRSRKGERKDAVMAEHLRRFAREEGVLFVDKAQEKTPSSAPRSA